MAKYYRCYGLDIVCDFELPELLPVAAPVRVDVRIGLGAVGRDGLSHGQQLGQRLWAGGGALWLHIPGVARFLISGGGEIRIDPEVGADEDSIRLYLLGSAFGALLFQRGLLVLHGNAVRIGDGCMVCLGHSGTGKSTLAAAFMRRGYPILADDVVPVNDDCMALPGFPRIKLWQDAAERMSIGVDGLRRIRPDMEKFNLPAFDAFSPQPLAVKWVYVLERHNQGDVLLEPVQGMERFRLLHQNTYRVRFLRALELKAEHLRLCGRLSARIDMAKLLRPEHGDSVEQLVDRILADIAGRQ